MLSHLTIHTDPTAFLILDVRIVLGVNRYDRT